MNPVVRLPRHACADGPADEGAVAHCMGEYLGLMSALVFAWLDEVFAGE